MTGLARGESSDWLQRPVGCRIGKEDNIRVGQMGAGLSRFGKIFPQRTEFPFSRHAGFGLTIWHFAPSIFRAILYSLASTGTLWS
jgi:hypothetical protein